MSNNSNASQLGSKWGKALFDKAYNQMDEEAGIARAEHGFESDVEGIEFEEAFMTAALNALTDILKEHGYGSK